MVFFISTLTFLNHRRSTSGSPIILNVLYSLLFSWLNYEFLWYFCVFLYEMNDKCPHRNAWAMWAIPRLSIGLEKGLKQVPLTVRFILPLALNQ